ncbi:MAG: ABC transporter permease [Gemmatimonadota bacterium]
MPTAFFRCLASERLKLRRSLASWLILAGGLFVPVIVLAARLRRPSALPALYRSPDFWEKHWTQSWESMSILILPMMVILIAALVAQLEYRNNTWKQVHTSPQPLATIFLAKLMMILVMLVQLFVVLNVGVFLSGALPALLVKNSAAFAPPIPYALFAKRNLHFFIDCLPVVALQYLLSLQFKNFMVPVGVGLALWIGSIGFLNTSFNYAFPYALTGVDFLIDGKYRTATYLPVNVQSIAVASFVAVSLVSYVLYATKKERG